MEYKADDGSWQPYDSASAKRVLAAYQEGKTASLNIGKYLVDLVAMTQTRKGLKTKVGHVLDLECMLVWTCVCVRTIWDTGRARGG